MDLVTGYKFSEFVPWCLKPLVFFPHIRYTQEAIREQCLVLGKAVGQHQTQFKYNSQLKVISIYLTSLFTTDSR
jgi:hypothetical protein